MKYQVGQKVRIIPTPPKVIKQLNWALDMNRRCNEIVTIISNKVGIYDGLPAYLTTANGGWTWKEDWLLPVSNFQRGDNVIRISTQEIFKWFEDIPYKDEELQLVSRKQLI